MPPITGRKQTYNISAMAKRITAGKTYLLHWSRNPFTWNEDLKDLISKKKVEKINGRYYTKVIAHMSGNFYIVDCTCDQETDDFYPINTSLLKPY